MPDRIVARAQRAIQEKTFPGCVVGVVKNGERTIIPFGTLIYHSEITVGADTIYDLASITKSIPVASLILLFIESSRLNLDDRVVRYLPELKNDFGATIEDLLRYRVHGPQLSSLKFSTFEEVRTHIFDHGFDGPPGESEYSNLPAFLLGIIVERVGGAILPALAQKYFFEPLKMNDTTFFPQDIDRIAPTEIVGGKEVCGIVHDESARIFGQARRAVGHAGLFSTAPDILNFLEALLRNEFPAVVAGAQKGLGWELSQRWMGKQPDKKTFGKTGFTGTMVLCDAERKTGLVILSNRTYPHRPADSSAINTFRSDIVDIVLN